MDKHNHPLPRRGFLRLVALGAGAGLLSACKKALETLTPTLACSLSPTPPRARPQALQPPDPHSDRSGQLYPDAGGEAEPWERGREAKDKTLTQMMFPFIGGLVIIKA